MGMGEVIDWVKENVLRAILMGLGGVLMLLGFVQMMNQSRGTEVVVEEGLRSDLTERSDLSKTLVVDVEGAVEKPGVFELDEGMRVADALVAAGGLAAEADRNYIARELNQAQVLTDGMKIFIPAEGDQLAKQMVVSSVGDEGLISVNTATESQLERLWGVGTKRAKDIVANRPYQALEELVSKAGIPENVLAENKGKLSL